MLCGRGHKTLCILLPHIVIHNIFHWVFNLNQNGVIKFDETGKKPNDQSSIGQ